MCFGKKDHYDPSAVAAKPTNYPPPQPTYASVPSDSKMASGPPQQATYAPPDGPPPSQQAYAPPSGPPPSHAAAELDGVSPPSGPPPSKGAPQELPAADYTQPPPGPPPAEAKAKHDWESVVPDTSLFPPPPDVFGGFERSPANNATEAEAAAGTAWCAQHPLGPPVRLDAPALGALEHHNIRLMPPSGFAGTLDWRAPGVWAARTPAGATDSCIIGYPPLYCVSLHSPLPGGPAAGAPKTIYYEARVRDDSRANETSLALGFAALPYPPFRLPGWHRASLAVHGDDGHRYVNDILGGHSFTAPFRRGDTYGIGMRLSPGGGGPGGGLIDVEVFFTRNGQEAGRWNLHEETDASDHLPVSGLEGYHDLSCAIGTFDAVSVELVFDPDRWLYKGASV